VPPALPLWPNENQSEKSNYPLRIRFRALNVSGDWGIDKVTLAGTGIGFYDGLNYIERGRIDTANAVMQKLATKLKSAKSRFR